MIDRLPRYFQFERYGISPRDIVLTAFHCEPEQIQADVIFMPSWKIEIFTASGAQITELVPGSVYQLETDGRTSSVIRSGVGAPLAGDAMLALGCTPCTTAVFIGSAGGLGTDIAMGDLVVVEKSVCGDGFSRYLEADIHPQDRFEKEALPDLQLTGILTEQALQACRAAGVPLHTGMLFSTDSIMAQFFRLDHISMDLGCIGIEMETAAFFQAAALVGIRAAALLEISDLPAGGKNLFTGRSLQEKEKYRATRRDVLVPIVLRSFSGNHEHG